VGVTPAAGVVSGAVSVVAVMGSDVAAAGVSLGAWYSEAPVDVDSFFWQPSDSAAIPAPRATAAIHVLFIGSNPPPETVDE
jgi:hypothetical protein